MNVTRTNIVIALLDDVLGEKYVGDDDKIANLERIAETATRMGRGLRQRQRAERNSRPEPVPRAPINIDADNVNYPVAVKIVRDAQKASTSLVQRHLQIGYNAAARLIERMEHDGIISPADQRTGWRKVLSPLVHAVSQVSEGHET